MLATALSLPIHLCLYLNGGRVSSVYVEITLRSRRLRSRNSVTLKPSTRAGLAPYLLSSGYQESLFFRIKRPRREAEHLPLSFHMLKMRETMPRLPHVFMATCLITGKPYFLN